MDEIDDEVKFRFWQEADLKPTFRRRRCHRGRPAPRKRSKTLTEIQGEGDGVMHSITRTYTVRFEETVADQALHLFR